MKRMGGRRAAEEFAAVVERPAERGGTEPPDVIDVLLPGARRGRRARWQHPLALCALGVTVAALAATAACRLWPHADPAPAEHLGARPAARTLPSSPPATRATTPAAGPRVLQSGDRGPDVTALQRLLFDQGFTYVSQTGVYDAATVRGVRQLQSSRGLICDPPGVYGICTRAALTW